MKKKHIIAGVTAVVAVGAVQAAGNVSSAIGDYAFYAQVGNATQPSTGRSWEAAGLTPYALADGAVVAKRNVIKIKRVPEVLVWVLMSPIMFVLLFAYVFGGAIDIPGLNYREFLIAGMALAAILFGALYRSFQIGVFNSQNKLPAFMGPGKQVVIKGCPEPSDM
jgi:hypothetical protein